MDIYEKRMRPTMMLCDYFLLGVIWADFRKRNIKVINRVTRFLRFLCLELHFSGVKEVLRSFATFPGNEIEEKDENTPGLLNFSR